MADKVAVIVGVGPGLGSAVAKRFAREGFAVALLARGNDKLEPVQTAIDGAGGHALSLTVDATDPAAVTAAFASIKADLGPVDVLVYNAGSFKIAGILDITPEVFDACWKANCAGALYAVQQVLPDMVDRAAGTVIFTGATAANRGGSNFACLAVGKFGLRALAQSTAREFGPKGVHVAHVVIDGMIDIPQTRAMFPDKKDEQMLSPDAIADTYWHLHLQHPTAWTQEVDLRPAVEKF